MKTPSQPIQYHQVSPDHADIIDAEVIVETPVTLTVNGEAWLTFMCTPVLVEEMAVGFLFNEGLLSDWDELADVRLCAAGDHVDVWLHKSVEQPKKWRRTSGCTGGMTSVENQLEAPLLNGATLPAESVGFLIGQLFENQDLYRTSGGVHTSALADGRQIHIVAEDIGRHNTLDKIAGLLLKKNISLTQRVILTTGRISSEMLQKSARMSVAVVISRTSPSSLSIQLAEQMGITLIGYARRNRFNIYTHPERITCLQELAQPAKRPIFS